MTKINIKTQIRLGFFVVSTIMLITIIYLILQMQSISKNTKLIYEHPYKVSNTLKDIQIEIYKTARLLLYIRYAENSYQIDSLINEITQNDSIVNNNFKMVYQLYLGSKSDVDSAVYSFNKWLTIKNKLYDLKRKNKNDSIDYVIKNQNHPQVNNLTKNTNKISAFAKNKAESTYSETIKAQNKAFYISIIILIITSLFIFFFTFYLSRSITKPIKIFVNDANKILSLQSESMESKTKQEEELFGLTLDELKKTYQNVAQQNEEIKSFNEQLSSLNISLEEKVRLRTLELQNANEQLVKESNEQKKIGEALKEGEEKFKNVFEYSIVGKSMTTIDGELRTNKAFKHMLGYSEEELKNIKWQQITHKEDIERDQIIINSIVSGCKTSARWEKRYIHKNRNIVWVDISTSLQRDSLGNPLYFITGIIDITERKQLEEKLLQKINELEIFNNITVNRELKMIELKNEINMLLISKGKIKKYRLDEEKT